MSAVDDYQYGERGAQHYTMCHEIDRLRAENDRLRALLIEAREMVDAGRFEHTTTESVTLPWLGRKATP